MREKFEVKETVRFGRGLFAGMNDKLLNKMLTGAMKMLEKEMQKGKLRRGWGAIYAKVKVGKSEWQTSIFPDRL